MGAIKSTSEAIRPATDAIDLINSIQNGAATPAEILDKLSQIGVFTEEIA